MQISWEHIEPLFRSLEDPNCGERKIWDRWYQEAWSHVVDAGLANPVAPIDGVRIKLRVLALWWLVYDFCATALNESLCEFYWKDLLSKMDIDPMTAFLTVAGDESIERSLSSAEVLQPEMFNEAEPIGYIPHEVVEDMTVHVIAFATFRQRADVVNALLDGFGSTSMLFASMHACCCDHYTVICEQRIALRDEIEEITSELETASGIESFERLQGRLRIARQQLESEALAQFAINELRSRALSGGFNPIDERLQAFAWCEERCPVVVSGTP